MASEQNLENISNGHNSNDWHDVLSRRSRRLLWARTDETQGRFSGNFNCENLGEKVWISPISSFTPSFATSVNVIPLGGR